ncbi:maleate cis-trans isomerase family protein [Chitinasiproducens palmae]|uniref:Maleate isomerase n=1 Tax=Chitinasiproducens palmae TaxID=1770053 RepID=A0A1H2PLG5_9BURK|nr:AroM family protein [Chitinasiproducens palmae]SDV47293.1 maleate isomerase [Chitinasiproducens palmae]
MSLGFGSRARIGHLYPSGGLCDYEIQLMAPAGVQFVTTRLPFRDTSIASDHAIIDDLERHAALLADARVSLIALNCTAAGVVGGAGTINARIEASTGIPAVTTIEAVMAACRAAGARRVGLLTPYRAEVVSAEKLFLQTEGISVVSEAHLPQATPVEQAEIAPARWLQLARELDADIDAILVSCAGIQLATVIASIEAATGKPVICSNGAMLWYCLSRLRVEARPPGYGALLAGRFD